MSIFWLLDRLMPYYAWVKDLFLFASQQIVWILILICVCFFFVLLKIPECFRPNWANNLRDFTESERFIEWISSKFPIFGSKSTQHLLLIPNADQQYHKKWWNFFKKSDESSGFFRISQDALTRYLLHKDTADLIEKLNSNAAGKVFDYEMRGMLSNLGDLKKEYKIIEFEVHQSSMYKISDPFGIYHTFIVFKTTSETGEHHWWSLEKNTKDIVIQESRYKLAVETRVERKDRKRVETISKKETNENFTMADLLITMWTHNIIPEKYHVVKSNCQTFVQFIEKAYNQSSVGTRHGTTFEPVVPYIPNKIENKLEPFIKLLTKFPEWKPLFAIIYLGDPVLLENLWFNEKKYREHSTDVNFIDYGTTLLQLAILFSRTKMVESILRNRNLKLTATLTLTENETSEMPWTNMSVFHTAAAFTNDTKIIDLLLRHKKVKTDPDANGRTALHIAAKESNETAVGHLLKIKPELNIPDNEGLTPFHLAAHHTDNIKVIDSILNAKKANPLDRGIDDWDNIRRTALHHAVLGSNLTTARHLMKRGANPNVKDSSDLTPLELAARHANDMKIIDLFLKNEVVLKKLRDEGGDKVYSEALENQNDGLYNEIEHRLQSQGIVRKQPIPLMSTGSTSDAGNNKEEKETLEERKQDMTTISRTWNCSIL